MWKIEDHYLQPGVRMYNNLKTIFYNGEKLWKGDDEYFVELDLEEEPEHPLVYNRKERKSWQQIVVLPVWKRSQCVHFKAVLMLRKL